MSIYSEVSKRIGWRGRAIELPTLKVAQELHRRILENDVEAFEEVFRYHRFAKVAMDSKEQAVAQVLWDAYIAGTRQFKD